MNKTMKVKSLRTKKSELEGTIIKTEKSLHLDSGDLDAHSGQKSQYAKELETAEDKLQELTLHVSSVNKELAMKKRNGKP